MDSYGRDSPDNSKFIRLGKFVAVPWKLVRLTIYVFCLTLLQIVKVLSSKYALGFNYRYEFEERPEWAWLDVEWRKLLKYKLRIEKKR